MSALRRLEVQQLPTDVAGSSRAISSRLVPLLDGCALLAAVAISGWRPVMVVFAVLAFVALNVDPSRAHRLDPRVVEELGWFLSRTGLPLLGLLTMRSLDVLPSVLRVGNVDRLAVWGGVAIGLVLLGRAVAYGSGRAARARGIVSEPTLIVGTGPLGVELARALQGHPEFGLRPIGFVDGPTAQEDLPLPLLGGPHDLEGVVAEFEVRRLVVAFGHSNDRDVTALLRELELLPVEVHVVPRFFELGAVPRDTDDLCGVPLVHLRRPALRPAVRVAKRALDIAVASSVLIVTAPILTASALAIKVSGPGPVLYRQARIGRHGRSFEILKFRTMTAEEELEPSWAIAHHRVTRVGRVLRRASIDELPQLINVLKGDMSIVGPRPERPHFVEQFSEVVPGYADRHRVHGGITGLAQVNGRSRGLDSIPERVRLDNAYIESQSLWGDIVIMIRTLQVVFRGDRGA